MKYLISIVLTLVLGLTQAQSLVGQLERESILLGERNALKFTLASPINPAELPEFSTLKAVKMSNKKDKDSVVVEVLDFKLDVNELTLFITAWDSGVVVIPPFALNQSGTLLSEATMFRVEFPQVDENGEILDIYEVSFDIPLFQDFTEKFWWLIDLLVVLLFVAGMILILRVKDSVEVLVEPEVIIPSDEKALAALAQLYRKAQFETNEQKLHFAEFSDILRSYIAARYQVVTFEKTTFELINALRLKSVPVEQRNFVEELLSVSDMIKFSKATTDETEMLRLKDTAVHFIGLSTRWVENEAIKQKGESDNA